MAKQLWRSFTKRRRWWPPSPEFAIAVLAAVFGVWPVVDPGFKYKTAYLAVVAVLLVVAALLSANDRWKVEDRQRQRDKVQLSAMRSRVMQLMIDIAQITSRQVWAKSAGIAPPNVTLEFSPFVARTISLCDELPHYGVSPDPLKKCMASSPQTDQDVRVMVGALENISADLGNRIIVLGDRFDMPRLRVNPKLKRGRDQAAKVMAQNLCENLVHLRGRRLGANAATKLGL